MSRYGNGGMVGSEPCAVSGHYIREMSDYGVDCRYDHNKASGDDACRTTALYRDFL
jgi:deoxyribodipyrimidine photolyase-related protein